MEGALRYHGIAHFLFHPAYFDKPDTAPAMTGPGRVRMLIVMPSYWPAPAMPDHPHKAQQPVPFEITQVAQQAGTGRAAAK